MVSIRDRNRIQSGARCAEENFPDEMRFAIKLADGMNPVKESEKEEQNLERIFSETVIMWNCNKMQTEKHAEPTLITKRNEHRNE